MEEQKNTYENVTLEPDVGFDIRFVTMDHNSPFHWHREMEILYILNGHATVHMEGEEYEPVSYTHLDVYKRQMLHSMRIMRRQCWKNWKKMQKILRSGNLSIRGSAWNYGGTIVQKNLHMPVYC